MIFGIIQQYETLNNCFREKQNLLFLEGTVFKWRVIWLKILKLENIG